jgi:hypothetical protein
MFDPQKIQDRIQDLLISLQAWKTITTKDRAKLTKTDKRRREELEIELQAILEPAARSELIVDVHMVARFFGITIRAVQKWVAKGCPKLKHGMYDLVAVFRWWVEMFSKGEESAAIEEVKLDYWKWKAMNERLKAQTAEGVLIPQEVIAAMWAARMGEVIAGLQAFAYRLPPLLDGKNQEEMHGIINREQRQLRENYCREGKFCPPVEGQDKQ